ncbi:hypothetical protein SCLCIDRAFT_1211404 [Scleroderma citrinum Foug A]|uniref:Uncharacterized protein n=1 Tax=Scleroderma citrinum Foug A TaxID=1036808 RepID=A0A0C3ECY6_9AGAM|nr:hypothetical protein SCLCIDRAFT_1211404 [Scleroderma citrinum Foug A]
MGSLCSKLETHSGGHHVLGGAGARQQNYGSTVDARMAAAAAAERRIQQEQVRGTHASNPKRGHLASQLAASKSTTTPAAREEQRLVWD